MIDFPLKIANHEQVYSEDGVLFPQRVISEDEAKHLRNEFAYIENAFGGELPYVGNLHLTLKWAHDLVLHPNILAYITPLLGDDIAVLGSLVLTKYPHSEEYVSWHQDGINSKWNADHSLSVWLALTKSNSENGCMRVIPKSHCDSKLEHIHYVDGNNMLRNAHEVEVEVDEEQAIDLELLPGEISVHHNNIIHGSGPNSSDMKRMGFIVRYVNSKHINPGKRMVYAQGATIRNDQLTITPPDEFLDKEYPEIYKAFLEKNIVLK